jgi:predicted O-methyltransferase YrrM
MLTNHGRYGDIGEQLEILESIIIDNNLKSVLELGVREGVSTIHFLLALKKTNGKLISIDIEPCEEAIKLIKEFNCEDIWTFVQSDDININIFGLYDLIFIDTSHTYNHTLNELNKYSQLLKKDGFIILHDISNGYKDSKNEETHGNQVTQAINDFNHYDDWDIIWKKELNGLAIMRKKK